MAEDDEDFRNLIAFALRRDGYEVTDVANGRALLDEVRRQQEGGKAAPALAISDERMPGLTGLGAFKALREAGVGIPLVLITAFGSDDLIDEAAKSGATVMRKPFDIRDLCTLVRYLIADGTSPQPIRCTGCGATSDVSWLDADSGVLLCRVCRELSEQIEFDG